MHIQSDSGSQSRYLVRASYLQIYNEVVSDLLKPEKTNLVIHEDTKRGVHVHGLSEWVVKTPDEVCSSEERSRYTRSRLVRKPWGPQPDPESFET